MRELESLSVVVPGLNESEMLPLLYRELVRVLGGHPWRLEILFVDDGSTDDSLTICERLHREDPRFNYVALSRNFGHQRALTAGLDYCTGQVIAVMDADLQDPPEIALEMIERWKQGVDVVYGQRRSRAGETAFKKLTAAAYYRIIRFFSGMSLPADTGDFRVMDRKVVESLAHVREQGRFMRGLVHWVGFRQEPLLYDRPPRAAGETKYPFFKMLRFAWDGITSFSSTPLRLAMWVGVIVFLVAVVLIVVFFVRKVIFHDQLVPGWTALFMTVLAFGGVQMFFIGVLGEYVAKCFEEAKGRPLYLVRGGTLAAPNRQS